MKLKLIQTGGIVGKTMAAQVNSGLKNEELARLLATIKKKATRGRAKDAHQYILQKDDDSKGAVTINIDAIPPEHAALFKKLFDNLKAVD